MELGVNKKTNIMTKTKSQTASSFPSQQYPFTSDGWNAAFTELYALDDDDLYAQIQSLLCDPVSWANLVFKLTADQQASLDSFALVDLMTLSVPTALAALDRFPISMTPATPPSASGSKVALSFCKPSGTIQGGYDLGTGKFTYHGSIQINFYFP